MSGPLDCARCDASVDPIRVWHGWKHCFRVWLGGLVVMLAMTPLLAYDFCVLIERQLAGSETIERACGGASREARPVS